MYSFSFVVASRYALPISAPQTFKVFSWIGIWIVLGILLRLLLRRCCLLDQELGDHLLLISLYGAHHVCMQIPGVPCFLVSLMCVCDPFLFGIIFGSPIVNEDLILIDFIETTPEEMLSIGSGVR